MYPLTARLFNVNHVFMVTLLLDMFDMWLRSGSAEYIFNKMDEVL